MKVLGLDLSSKASGWSIFEDGTYKSSGVITATSTDLIRRISKITKELDRIIEENQPDKIIFEEVLPTVGHNSNTNVLRALYYMQASVVFLLHDKYSKIPHELILPNSWRAKLGIHTGRGVNRTSLKQADIKFAEEHFGIKCSDDEADAACIAYSWFKENKDAVPDYNWN